MKKTPGVLQPEETAVCNLASIALPRFVRERNCEKGREAKKLVSSWPVWHPGLGL